VRKDIAAAIKQWESQPKSPYDLCEQLALALAYANQGDPTALPLIELIRSHSPRDAEAIAAVHAARSGQIGPAIEKFASLFRALRDDPTPTRRVVDHALLVASQTAEKHPQHIRPLFESLEQPLAVAMFEDRRCGLLASLGQLLGGREFTAGMLQLEPFPPWDGTILAARVQAYKQTNHPLLARAEREFNEFQRGAPEAAVLLIPKEEVKENGPAGPSAASSPMTTPTAAP
jgi:hypothetical protein